MGHTGLLQDCFRGRNSDPLSWTCYEGLWADCWWLAALHVGLLSTGLTAKLCLSAPAVAPRAYWFPVVDYSSALRSSLLATTNACCFVTPVVGRVALAVRLMGITMVHCTNTHLHTDAKVKCVWVFFSTASPTNPTTMRSLVWSPADQRTRKPARPHRPLITISRWNGDPDLLDFLESFLAFRQSAWHSFNKQETLPVRKRDAKSTENDTAGRGAAQKRRQPERNRMRRLKGDPGVSGFSGFSCGCKFTPHCSKEIAEGNAILLMDLAVFAGDLTHFARSLLFWNSLERS